ncbi:MAG: hypothetical protein ACLTER_05445 [Ruminococcus sp.]
MSFSDSRYFQVAINHLPTILELLEKYADEYHGAPDLTAIFVYQLCACYSQAVQDRKRYLCK